MRDVLPLALILLAAILAAGWALDAHEARTHASPYATAPAGLLGLPGAVAGAR